MSAHNPYDVVSQPTMHQAFETSKSQVESSAVATLLYTLQQLDKMAEQLQVAFVEDVCVAYEGRYIYSRGSMLFELANAVRKAAIRIEQVPQDLRAEVEAIVIEATR